MSPFPMIMGTFQQIPCEISIVFSGLLLASWILENWKNSSVELTRTLLLSAFEVVDGSEANHNIFFFNFHL